MSLLVFTARISTRDPDRLDITRKSGGPAGEPFAPSWAILRPALDARREHDRLMNEALRLAALPERMVRESEYTYRLAAEEVLERAWSAYVPAYVAEMRESYRRNRPAWDALLARPRVVLACFCTDQDHCHRRLLAGILVKLGATDGGELP